MTVDTTNGKHVPANPDKFEFDAEVTAVFDNMATRSILGYVEAYRVLGHLAGRMNLPKFTQVWDIGTSTGKGLASIKDGVGLNPYIEYHGVDVSEPMIAHATKACPFATIHNHDICLGLPDALKIGSVSIMVFGWVLQFIRDERERARILQEAYESLRPGGFIAVMEKYRINHPIMDGVLQDSYIAKRIENGYSLGEIEAKTAALKNSMWPSSPDFAADTLRALGADVQTLYREMNFGGIVAFKKG